MLEEKYDFQRTYTLLPQSPLIHFQWDQNGAALRATEVKPKLDRYIIKRLGESNIPSEWRNNQSPGALNYKLRIVADGVPETTLLGYISRKKAKTPEEKDYAFQGCPYDIFFGNTGDVSEKRGVTVDMKLTVDCFIEELREYIDSVIGDFFIVTNFGTMQSKGFGSFIVDEKENDPNHICQTLIAEYQANACYRFKASKSPFKQIKCLYSLMKTGVNQSYMNPPAYRRSILFDYMHEQGFGNEKAWLKQKQIAPALGKNVDQNDEKSRYVRALFGIGEEIEFKNSLVDANDKVSVKIKDSEGKIERLNSPVFFKVINNTVYYIGMPINEEIYGKTFTFSSSMGRGEISVPRKEDLPEDFINDFMHYAFTKLNICSAEFRDIKGLRLEEVKRNGK